MCERACPVCGSTDTSHIYAQADFDPEALGAFAFASRKIPEFMHYRTIHCQQCDLLYASPIPTLDTISVAYDEAAFDSGIEAEYAAQTYGAFLPDILRQLPDADGALDIGTGDGAFLKELLKHKFTNVAGVEPSTAPIAAADPAIRPLIRQGLFRVEDYPDERFRLITCFQTIEHLYEPRDVCRSAYALLKDNGAFFLICHNRRGLLNRVLKNKSPIMDIEHLQLFSPASVRRLMEEIGFQNITVKAFANSYPLRYWMRLTPLPMGLKKRLLSWLDHSKFGAMLLTFPVGNLAVVGYKRDNK